MEKRKSKLEKILTHFDEIIEEKLALEDNAKQMIDRVFLYVRYVRNSTHRVNQTDLSEILKYELEILARLTDINSELENFLEEDPLTNLVLLENTPEPTVEILESPKHNWKFDDIPESSCDNDYINNTNPFRVPLSSDYLEQAIPVSVASMDDTITSLTNLQDIRNSLKQFSLKLGLKEDTFSCNSNVPSIPHRPIIVPESISNSDSDSLGLPVRDFSLSCEDSKRMGNSSNAHDKSKTIQEDCSKLDNSSLCSNISNVESDNEDGSEIEMSAHSCERTTDSNSIQFDSCNNSPITSVSLSSSEQFKHSPNSMKQHQINHPTNSEVSSSMRKSSKKEQNREFFELRPKKTPFSGDECMFSYIVSPTEFYIHILDNETVSIDHLTKKIPQNYNISVPTHTSKELASADIGRFGLAFVPQYSGWFRAEILNWCLDIQSDEVLVQLVDYGMKQRLSYKNVRKMVEELANVPKLAVRCHFPLMYPPGSTRLNILSDWPEATIKALLDVSGISENEEKQNVIFKLVYAHQEEYSLAVDLYNPLEKNEDLTVGQILIDLGLAKQILHEVDEENMELEAFLDDVDHLETADNINEAVAGYDARDEARICRFTRRDGTCYKKNCKLEHAILPKDGFTMDTELIFKEAMYSLSLPSCGEWVTVLVTYYIDICRFFVQIINNAHREPKYLIDSQFHSLMLDMNSPKTVKTYESFKILPAIGEIVLVKHWTKKWLRAVVRELVNMDDVDADIHVFTVDVGETLKMNLKDLRKIKPHLLSLPFQAVECYIHDYKMRDDCSLDKARAFFDKNMYFHNFSAQVLSSFLPLKINLRSMNGFTDIGKTLEEQHFAEVRLRDDNPDDNCIVKLY